MSTLKVDTLQTTGGAGLYPAKAWVNFDGTGTVAIRQSGNVASITDNGTGDYSVNFTTALGSADYTVAGSASSAARPLVFVSSAKAVGSTSVQLQQDSAGINGFVDSAGVSVIVAGS